MKKVLGITLLVAVGAFIAFMTGCGPIDEVPKVTGLDAEAINNGEGIELSWTAVTVEGEDVTYTVYFDDEVLEEEITVTYYQHTAPGKTGDYIVTANAGGEEGPDSDVFSTDPEIVSTLQVYEINGTGSSGIGWNINTGAAASFSMADETNQDDIDCYFTNWAAGYAGAYDLSGPQMVGQDDGITWLDPAGWRTTGVTDNLAGNFDNIGLLPETGYYDYGLTAQGDINALFTEDGYYAVIEVSSISTANGTVDVRAAFQKVKGFRQF